MKKPRKRDLKALAAFAESIHDITLWAVDYENYFPDMPMPKEMRKVLTKLGKRVEKTKDVYRLLDWLDYQEESE